MSRVSATTRTNQRIGSLAAARASRLRRPASVSAVLLLAAVSVVLVVREQRGHTADQSPAAAVTAPEASGDEVSTSTEDISTEPATSRIELEGDQLRAGGELDGALVVDNPTDTDLEVLDQGCAPKWNVILVGGPLESDAAFTFDCLIKPLIVPPGESRFPITVHASVRRCMPPGTAEAGVPTCASTLDRMPPVPEGDYEAVFVGSLPGIAAPSPIPLVVTE